MLLLKLLLVPGLVAAVTLAVRRWGPAVGGWLAGLPVVAGPVLVFYAIEQGDAFAAQAAHATLAGLIATVAFAVVYARCSVRVPWYGCVVLGWTAFAATILVLYALQPALVPSLVSLVVATMLGRHALPSRVRFVPRQARDALSLSKGAEPGLRTEADVGRVPPKADPPGDLAIRLVATAALVLVLTGLAERLGATLSGLLNAFPVLTTIIAAFTHAQRGRAAVVAFLNGYLQSVVGFGLFCVVMAVTLVPFGLALAVLAALLGQSVVPAWMLWRLTQSRRARLGRGVRDSGPATP